MDTIISSGATPQRAQPAACGGGAGAGGDWGWYSPYPTSRFEGSIALHYLVPLMNLCVRCILPKTTLGLSSVAALPDIMVRVMRICVRICVRVRVRVRAWVFASACVTERSSHAATNARSRVHPLTRPQRTHQERNGVSSEEYGRCMLQYEQAREGLMTSLLTLKLFHLVLSDEVLLLSQLRAECFLAQQDRGRRSAAERVFVGCAGLQDREDLHLSLFRALELDSGHNCMLKLLDSFQRPMATAARLTHKGLDELACAALNVLQRLVLYRCDRYVACHDRNLEGRVLELTAPLVHCMSRFALPVGLPWGPEEHEPQLPLAASRLLSMLCRLDLRPLTIRQSWEWREQKYVKPDTVPAPPGQKKDEADAKDSAGNMDRATKRALLDLATCHGQPVDTRVAVLAFVSEALASQPGLADWLFDSDGELQGGSGLSSEAGCAMGATDISITLDNRASDKDGYYNGWIVEIRGGKGLGQPPLVVSSYVGKDRIATLSKGWETNTKFAKPDKTSQYLISKQLQLRRVIKAFLHPQVSFSGLAPPSRASSERMLNRLKIMEYSLMLVETVWDTAAEERAGIVQGFSDPNCLPWGIASPDGIKVENKTSHWREYNMHLNVAGGEYKSFRIVAAPSDPYAEICEPGSDNKGGGRIVTKGQPTTPNTGVLGWIQPGDKGSQDKGCNASRISFWDTIQRHALGSVPASQGAKDKDLSIEWYFDQNDDASGRDAGGAGGPGVKQRRVEVHVKMPASLRRTLLPQLDAKTDKCRLFGFLKDRDSLERAAEDMSACTLDGSAARQIHSDLRRLHQLVSGAHGSSSAPEKLPHLKRIKCELEILDATLQMLEAQGVAEAERVDLALDEMWCRLRCHLVFTGIGGSGASTQAQKHQTPLPPVRLPGVLRKWLHDSLLEEDDAKVEPIERLWLGHPNHILPIPVSEAAECDIRRKHIEALAVSVCGLQLEEGEGVAPFISSDSDWKEDKVQMTKRLAKKALLELTLLDAPQLNFDREGGSGGEKDTDTSMALDRSSAAVDIKGSALGQGGDKGQESLEEALRKLDGLQHVAIVAPEGMGQTQLPRHRHKVEYKLKTLHDFSADWLYDTKRVEALYPPLVPVASGLNLDQAQHDIEALRTTAYCRFLQAAAHRCPAALLSVLRNSQASAGGGQSLAYLLTSLADRLNMGRAGAGGDMESDLQVQIQLAHTLSVLIHCGWPLLRASALQARAAGRTHSGARLLKGPPAVRLLSALTKTLEVQAEQSKGALMTEEDSAMDAQKLDRDSLYEALVDCVMRLLLHVQDMLAQRSRPHDASSAPAGDGGSCAAFGDSADGELDSNLWGGANVLVRLSSVVGDHLKRSGGLGGGGGVGGATARKSCALLTLLGRMSAWNDRVHWESLLDQAFWKQSPGLLLWMSGSHTNGYKTTGDPSSESLYNKEAAADALAALDVVLDVAQHERGAASLAANSVLLYLRQGGLQAKVLAADGQSFELYTGAGNSPARNPWHTVWCRSLQAVQVLSIRLDTSEPQLAQASLDETLAFVVTFHDRLQWVLPVLVSSLLSSGHTVGRTAGATAMSGWGGGWKGASGVGAGGAQVYGALGSQPSLALLEEAKLWTAVLLRLARKLPVWRTQAPKLALFMIEHIPRLVVTLTDALIRRKGDVKEDCSKFAERFRPVSDEEQLLASKQAAASQAGREQHSLEEPRNEALTPMDDELREAFEVVKRLSTAQSSSLHEHSVCWWE